MPGRRPSHTNRQAPRAPSHSQGVTSQAVTSHATSDSVTHPSSLIRAHAPDQNPPTAFCLSIGQRILAGCCQPLLGDGPSRRYLCESFPGCLDPYPGGSLRCTRPFLPKATAAFPALGTGRLPTSHRTGDFRAGRFSRLQSFSNVQAPRFARHSDRPYPSNSLKQQWLLRPSLSQFVTSPSIGYASRPNRAMDGRGLSPHKIRSLVGCSPNGSAHKLRRYQLPRAKMPNVHGSRQAHNSMTSLSTKGADSFMGLLASVLSIAATERETCTARPRERVPRRRAIAPGRLSRSPQRVLCLLPLKRERLSGAWAC